MDYSETDNYADLEIRIRLIKLLMALANPDDLFEFDGGENHRDYVSTA
jgi:hypothetical protein